ncbi:MAG: hypothetical protein JRJ29_10385, partial [Deltaproteobacteria bacterium]|nr:hypothetical protein [Deltaproteobacteria bacterium]
YSPELRPMKSLGYRHALKYIMGEWDRDKTIATLQRDTRRYAKRQLTWFRGDFEFHWLGPEQGEKIVGLIKDFLRNDEPSSSGHK